MDIDLLDRETFIRYSPYHPERMRIEGLFQDICLDHERKIAEYVLACSQIAHGKLTKALMIERASKALKNAGGAEQVRTP